MSLFSDWKVLTEALEVLVPKKDSRPQAVRTLELEPPNVETTRRVIRERYGLAVTLTIFRRSQTEAGHLCWRAEVTSAITAGRGL